MTSYASVTSSQVLRSTVVHIRIIIGKYSVAKRGNQQGQSIPAR